MDTLDYRFNSLPTIVQYNIYCDGSFTPQVHATTKKQGADQKAGWAFVVAAQTTPRAEDEVIVGISAGPLLSQDMAYHVLDKQSAETAEAFAFHQAVKWSLAQTVFFCTQLQFVIIARGQGTQPLERPQPQPKRESPEPHVHWCTTQNHMESA